MATSISNPPVFIHACGGTGANAACEPMFMPSGAAGAEKLVDDAAIAHASRMVVTGTPADAPSRSARCKKLVVTSVTVRVAANSRRTVTALAGSKRRQSDASQGALAADDAFPIAAETIQAAVLFADMRGYTGLAEQLPPAQVVSILNEFSTMLARVTMAFGGKVFHMAGDGMMAGFGLRDSRRSGACAALAAGQAMLRCFAPVETRWRAEFAIVTGVGIGLHVGDVALGFLGPPGQQAITMIGDTANVAARLCGRARAGEVLFSSAVAVALADDGGALANEPKLANAAKPFLLLPQFELCGRGELLDIWCVPSPESARYRESSQLRTETLQLE